MVEDRRSDTTGIDQRKDEHPGRDARVPANVAAGIPTGMLPKMWLTTGGVASLNHRLCAVNPTGFIGTASAQNRPSNKQDTSIQADIDR